MADAGSLAAAAALPPAVAVAAGCAAAGDALAAASAARGPAGSPRAVLERAYGPVREAVRLLVQQPRRTAAGDGVLRTVGVVLLPVAAVLAAVVLPWGSRAVADPAVGVVWFNAMEALAWASVWLVGWGPNSALALVGGYRFLAQGLAYELPHMFALTTAALGAQSLRVGAVAAAQAELWFVAWMPAAFAVYLVSAVAMAFWGPFGGPVGGELAGGAAAELGGPDRLLFLGGRWLLLTVAAAMSVPLFLGGGHGPLLPPWVWTVLKTAAVLAGLVWVRRRLPTVRMERWTPFSWLVLMPLTLLQALVVAVVVLVR